MVIILAALIGWWAYGTEDFAGPTIDVLEPVLLTAVEIISVSGPQDLLVRTYRHLNRAGDDDARLLRRMREHAAGVGPGRVGFMQQQYVPVGMVDTNHSIGNISFLADLDELPGAVERRIVATGPQFREKAGERGAKRVEHRGESFDRGAHAVALNQRDGGMRYAGAERQFTRAQMPSRPQFTQLGTNLWHVQPFWCVYLTRSVLHVAAANAIRDARTVETTETAMSQQLHGLPGITYVKAPAQGAGTDTVVIEARVRDIVALVRRDGDAALAAFSREFDGAAPAALEVSIPERREAVRALDPQTRRDTEFAIANVRAFAEAQLTTIRPIEVEIRPGVHLGHRVIPIRAIGAYVPGGRYPLLSAPVMTIVPARVAGCKEIVTCLPPGAHPAMVAGCHLAGADRIFRVGGAQAIAAMAFGTATIPAVDKIVGPGNAYVNEAKRQVFGPVGIDQLAGPSEIYILADHTGDAETIATDLLAQAEHDVRTRVGLITTDRALAEATAKVVERQLVDLPTANVAGAAWRENGEIILCDSEATMICCSDRIAAEHLQVHTAEPHALAARLRNYGSLFIGVLSSVVYSDKCSGTNHTLPTLGAGRYTGGLWVGSFVKICTHQWLEPAGVAAVAPPAMRQSAAEGLEGHRRAAALRHHTADLS